MIERTANYERATTDRQILNILQDGFDSCLVAVYYVNGSSARISADRNALLSPIEFSSAGIEIGV